jgi:hypothetical protein
VGPKADLIRFGEDQNLLPLPRMEPRYLGCPARELDTILPELPRIPMNFVLLFKLMYFLINGRPISCCMGVCVDMWAG